MKVSLYLIDKIMDFKLPNVVSGSYSFDFLTVDSKLINIEARDGDWFLYGTDDVSVIYNDNFVSDVKIVVNNFYILKRDNVNYLIYVSDFVSSDILTFSYNKSLNLVIGNSDQCNIRYNCSYLRNGIIRVYFKNNFLVLDNSSLMLLYINKRSNKDKLHIINYGDVLELYGLKIRFLNGLLLIDNLGDKIFIDKSSASINNYIFPDGDKFIDVEVKDVDLYSKDDYFSKSPRVRRVIESKNIKLSPPPKDGDSKELPLLLVLGPMMTMGVMSFSVLLNTLSKIGSGDLSFSGSWPQLVTSGAMLVSMIVWPLVTQGYNRNIKKKNKKEIIRKYSEYINSKKEELLEIKKTQSIILNENLITVNECLNIIEHRSVNFWDKRIDQNDFLVVRIGIGNEYLDVVIDYPDQGFTIEENELKDQADKLISDFKYLENVPIKYSFKENRTTAIMGPRYKTFSFLNNIILQLITFYSYEDLKLVLFTNESRKKSFDYLRYLNHTFTNDRSFRFFASDFDSTKMVSEYLSVEFNSRINQLNEGKSITFKPYYLVIVDDYDLVKRYDIIKNITESSFDIGFSLIILENRLSRLPSKCNNFITIGQKQSGVLRNSYENQKQITFYDEIKYNIDMMKIAKILSNIPIEFENSIKSLPDSISFLEIYKVGKVSQLNILNRWDVNDPTTSLRAPVGVDSQGDLMYLDLHEKAHGPHGLIAGMTGSGKSEFIITYILSMAINYSPLDVSFILIDYKGGGLAYSFSNKADGIVLPHLSGVITNLDKAEMDRTLVSIDSEIKRRQRIFNEARDLLSESTMDIYKYQRFYKEGRLEEAVSHLFIICDEFAELKSQQPEFMDNLISVARVGRSLGVHLILATQKPSGVVNDQIWSNTRFRVCLKVQDESDSREMLKRGDAASLRQPGRFYLQVGYDEYFALGQSAFCGSKYYPSEKIVKQVDRSVNFINDCGLLIKSIQASNGIRIKPQGEQLAAILDSIVSASLMSDKKARKLWLDNISGLIYEGDIISKYNLSFDGFPTLVLGEYDAPEVQEQGPLVYDLLKDGNTIIYGVDGSEREMMLSSIIYSGCKNYSARDLNFYILDYGSESLRCYSQLPHVGGMVFSSDDEKYNNLFKMIKEELKRRKRILANYGGEYTNYVNSSLEEFPLKVIIINNYDSIYDSNPRIYDDLPDVIRDSLRYGFVFIITCNSFNSVQSKIAQNCDNIYTFRQKDSSDYSTIFGVRTSIVPRDIKGRGLLNNGGVHEFQTATVDVDFNEFILDVKKRNDSSAFVIPTLPDIVRFDDVKNFLDSNRVPIGISKNDLEVCCLDYLSNLGNIVTSNRIDNTKIFIQSLIMEFERIDNFRIFIFDPFKGLNINSSYLNYFSSDLEEKFDLIIEYLSKLVLDKDSSDKGVVLFYGINKFLSKIKDKSKMDTFTKLIKEYENIGVIIVDDFQKIKSFVFDSWFSSIFSVNYGIFIGRGIADQNLLHLSTITKEMTREYKNDFGYLVSESVGVLVKFIDFVSDLEGIDYEK